MTTQVWVDQTRDMLLSGYVEDLDLVTTAPSPATTGTTLVIQGISSSIVKGVVIEVNSELMYVISVTSTTVSVMRGYGGSTAGTHTAGDVVRVSPKFPAHRIIQSINDDLADLSAPSQGLFQMKTTSFTYNSSVDGYDLSGLTSAEIDSIYSVTYADAGSAASEPEVSSWRLRRNRDTSSFSSGLALILYSGVWPGQTVTVAYKAPFTSISTTDLTTSRSLTGLAVTAYDLPPLGAAMALMTTTPIRREFLDAQGTSRMADEVPPGAISASFRDLMGRRRARVEAESGRLVSQYPQVWTRSSGMRPSNQWSGYSS
jgi:hypothetical protein